MASQLLLMCWSARMQAHHIHHCRRAGVSQLPPLAIVQNVSGDLRRFNNVWRRRINEWLIILTKSHATHSHVQLIDGSHALTHSHPHRSQALQSHAWLHDWWDREQTACNTQNCSNSTTKLTFDHKKMDRQKMPPKLWLFRHAEQQMHSPWTHL